MPGQEPVLPRSPVSASARWMPWITYVTVGFMTYISLITSYTSDTTSGLPLSRDVEAPRTVSRPLERGVDGRLRCPPGVERRQAIRGSRRTE
jgi:hypothetical protein